MWNNDGKCRKAHIQVKDKRCIDFAKTGLQHTIEHLDTITAVVKAHVEM
jgi:hypothetical protein